MAPINANFPPQQMVDAAPEVAAELSELFGTLDMCSCQHCCSVYSPAAYLVDLLEFLKRHSPAAYGALRKRRGDIWDTELSCKNTDTPIPYVDLVNEILENATAPFEPFSLLPAYESDLDNRVISPGIRNYFRHHHVALSDDAIISVSPMKPGKWWRIADVERVYHIRSLSGQLSVQTEGIQTRGTSAELGSNPGHVNLRAYDVLAAQVHPWNLPLNLSLEEGRIYLDHLGVSRAKLMATFREIQSPALTDTDIASEFLRLSPFERTIITGQVQTLPPELQKLPAEFWGFKTSSNWLALLSRVPRFLSASGLPYRELLELLDTSFLNSFQTSSGNAVQEAVIKLVVEGEGCALEEMTLFDSAKNSPTVPEIEAALDGLHRFLRLRRALHWSITGLDRTLTALGQPKLDDGLLVNLALIEGLRRDLGIPMVELVNWWGPIDIRSATAAEPKEVPSFFERLFLNKAVENPDEPDFQALFTALKKGKPAPTAALGDNEAGVRAAFRLSAGDFSLLTNSQVSSQQIHVGNSELPPDANLDLKSLSHLARIVSLARELKLRIRDILALKALTGINPFDGANIKNARRFVEIVGKIRSSGFTIVELDYLLRHVALAPSGVAPSDLQIGRLQKEIEDGINKIITETTIPEKDAIEKKRAVAGQQLGVFLDPEDVSTALQLIDGTLAQFAPQDAGYLSPGDQGDFIDNEFASFADTAVIKQGLIGANAIDPVVSLAERFDLVLRPLLDYLRRIQGDNFVRQKLGATAKLDGMTVDKLLGEWLQAPGDANQKAIESFRPRSNDQQYAYLTLSDAAREEADAKRHELQRGVYLRFDKAALIISKLRLTSDELAWANQQQSAWIDFNALPLEPAEEPAVPFTALERMVDLIAVRNRMPAGKTALFEVLDLATKAETSPEDTETLQDEYLSALSERTGWPLEDLKLLVGPHPNGFAYAFPEAFRNGIGLVQLSSCFMLLASLGMSVAQIASCIAPSLFADQAATIKTAAKAKYDAAQWIEIAKPLRDVLRERQRSALVAYLLRTLGLDDSNALFGRCLIDVEMSSCQLTSRIKQGISSVQTFIQRCFLNLESDSGGAKLWLDEDAVHEWEWRKVYRVWEANRKVLLHPGTYTEAELRDDKTPFFKALETELQQGDITNNAAEDAYLAYLEKLDQVARLEISGMYEEKEDKTASAPAVDVLHVFGRTAGSPHVYFCRRWIDKKNWTPWEKVDLDISSDWLIPVVFEGRLYLFWPILKEVPSETQSLNSKITATTHLQIALAWSQYKQNKWLSKKTSVFKALSDHVVQAQFVRRELIAFTSDVGHHGKIGTISPPQNAKLAISMIVSGGPGYLDENDPNSTTESFLSFLNPGSEDSSCKVPARFSFSGCDMKLLPEGPDVVGENLLYRRFPPGTEESYMALKERPDGVGKLLFSCLPNVSDNAPPNIILLELPSGGPYRLMFPQQHEWNFAAPQPFFLEDDNRTFFIQPGVEYVPAVEADPGISPSPPGTGSGGNPLGLPSVTPGSSPYADMYVALDGYRYRFQAFYHPYVCEITKRIKEKKIEGLLRWSHTNQSLQFKTTQIFGKGKPYFVSDVVTPQDLKEEMDFTTAGPYSVYNYEIFFHIVMLIAQRLHQSQRFEDARRWLHFVFDPTSGGSGGGAKAFWKFRPFYENEDAIYPIQTLMAVLADIDSGLDPQKIKELKKELKEQIALWAAKPFKPHPIDRLRLGEYQWYVVRKYIDNLCAWGDQLFQRDTIESINEATQLYILAADILGPRPNDISRRGDVHALTYRELSDLQLDDFGNAAVLLESLVDDFPGAEWGDTDDNGLPDLRTLYFCVPRDDKVLSYWDTVADRLFKIRHCMNIEGVARQLPLFEPPIDPALLVRAVAAGVDIGSVLKDLSAPMPQHRYRVLYPRAMEMASAVVALSAELHAALKNRDAEALTRLRAGHEIGLLKKVRQVKQHQIEEAIQAKAALQKSREMVESRYKHYRDIKFLNEGETVHLALSAEAAVAHAIIEGIQAAAAPSHVAPTMFAGGAGSFGSPLSFSTVVSGEGAGNAAEAGARVAGIVVALLREAATLSATMGGYKRRFDDWKLQERLAAKELEQLDKQITAADIRIAVAEQELENHDLQVENAEGVEAALSNQFTRTELYDWMVSQVSTVYFQTYQLACQMAKRAERAFQFECANPHMSFIDDGYWDSLTKGLLAGQKLQLDLRRVDAAFLNEPRPEFEITKHISVALTNPRAIMELRQHGSCEFECSEILFDFDFLGHYDRRIRSLSASIPCLAGPYTSVNFKLTLLRNSIRINTTSGEDSGDPYARNQNDEDSRFRDNLVGIQSAVTSHGQNDPLGFEEHLQEDHFHTFEGAGIISRWRIETDSSSIDLGTVSDVIFHLKYSARDGGSAFAGLARSSLEAHLKTVGANGLSRLFSVRHEFPNDWQRFLHPVDEAELEHMLRVSIGKERFPFMFRHKDILINKLTLFLEPDDKLGKPSALTTVAAELSQLDPGIPEAEPILLTEQGWGLKPASGSLTGLLSAPELTLTQPILMPTDLELILSGAGLSSLLPQPGIDNLWIVADYTVATKSVE
jgi:hypothetical protein